jgi:hypothetical protein
MFESGEHMSVRVSFRRQANSRRYALLAQQRKLRASNQHGPFGSLDATHATKRNANAAFGPFDATEVRQRMCPESPKKDTSYQSRPMFLTTKSVRYAAWLRLQSLALHISFIRYLKIWFYTDFGPNRRKPHQIIHLIYHTHL